MATRKRARVDDGTTQVRAVRTDAVNRRNKMFVIHPSTDVDKKRTSETWLQYAVRIAAILPEKVPSTAHDLHGLVLRLQYALSHAQEVARGGEIEMNTHEARLQRDAPERQHTDEAPGGDIDMNGHAARLQRDAPESQHIDEGPGGDIEMNAHEARLQRDALERQHIDEAVTACEREKKAMRTRLDRTSKQLDYLTNVLQEVCEFGGGVHAALTLMPLAPVAPSPAGPFGIHPLYSSFQLAKSVRGSGGGGAKFDLRTFLGKLKAACEPKVDGLAVRLAAVFDGNGEDVRTRAQELFDELKRTGSAENPRIVTICSSLKTLIDIDEVAVTLLGRGLEPTVEMQPHERVSVLTEGMKRIRKPDLTPRIAGLVASISALMNQRNRYQMVAMHIPSKASDILSELDKARDVLPKELGAGDSATLIRNLQLIADDPIRATVHKAYYNWLESAKSRTGTVTDPVRLDFAVFARTIDGAMTDVIGRLQTAYDGTDRRKVDLEVLQYFLGWTSNACQSYRLVDELGDPDVRLFERRSTERAASIEKLKTTFSTNKHASSALEFIVGKVDELLDGVQTRDWLVRAIQMLTTPAPGQGSVFDRANVLQTQATSAEMKVLVGRTPETGLGVLVESIGCLALRCPAVVDYLDQAANAPDTGLRYLTTNESDFRAIIGDTFDALMEFARTTNTRCPEPDAFAARLKGIAADLGDRTWPMPSNDAFALCDAIVGERDVLNAEYQEESAKLQAVTVAGGDVAQVESSIRIRRGLFRLFDYLRELCWTFRLVCKLASPESPFFVERDAAKRKGVLDALAEGVGGGTIVRASVPLMARLEPMAAFWARLRALENSSDDPGTEALLARLRSSATLLLPDDNKDAPGDDPVLRRFLLRVRGACQSAIDVFEGSLPVAGDEALDAAGTSLLIAATFGEQALGRFETLRDRVGKLSYELEANRRFVRLLADQKTPGLRTVEKTMNDFDPDGSAIQDEMVRASENSPIQTADESVQASENSPIQTADELVQASENIASALIEEGLEPYLGVLRKMIRAQATEEALRAYIHFLGSAGDAFCTLFLPGRDRPPSRETLDFLRNDPDAKDTVVSIVALERTLEGLCGRPATPPPGDVSEDASVDAAPDAPEWIDKAFERIRANLLGTDMPETAALLADAVDKQKDRTAEEWSDLQILFLDSGAPNVEAVQVVVTTGTAGAPSQFTPFAKRLSLFLAWLKFTGEALAAARDRLGVATDGRVPDVTELRDTANAISGSIDSIGAQLVAYVSAQSQHPPLKLSQLVNLVVARKGVNLDDFKAYERLVEVVCADISAGAARTPQMAIERIDNLYSQTELGRIDHVIDEFASLEGDSEALVTTALDLGLHAPACAHGERRAACAARFLTDNKERFAGSASFVAKLGSALDERGMYVPAGISNLKTFVGTIADPSFAATCATLVVRIELNAGMVRGADVNLVTLRNTLHIPRHPGWKNATIVMPSDVNELLDNVRIVRGECLTYLRKGNAETALSNATTLLQVAHDMTRTAAAPDTVPPAECPSLVKLVCGTGFRDAAFAEGLVEELLKRSGSTSVPEASRVIGDLNAIVSESYGQHVENAGEAVLRLASAAPYYGDAERALDCLKDLVDDTGNPDWSGMQLKLSDLKSSEGRRKAATLVKRLKNTTFWNERLATCLVGAEENLKGKESPVTTLAELGACASSVQASTVELKKLLSTKLAPEKPLTIEALVELALDRLLTSAGALTVCKVAKETQATEIAALRSSADETARAIATKEAELKATTSRLAEIEAQLKACHEAGVTDHGLNEELRECRTDMGRANAELEILRRRVDDCQGAKKAQAATIAKLESSAEETARAIAVKEAALESTTRRLAEIEAKAYGLEAELKACKDAGVDIAPDYRLQEALRKCREERDACRAERSSAVTELEDLRRSAAECVNARTTQGATIAKLESSLTALAAKARALETGLVAKEIEIEATKRLLADAQATATRTNAELGEKLKECQEAGAGEVDAEQIEGLSEQLRECRVESERRQTALLAAGRERNDLLRGADDLRGELEKTKVEIQMLQARRREGGEWRAAAERMERELSKLRRSLDAISGRGLGAARPDADARRKADRAEKLREHLAEMGGGRPGERRVLETLLRRLQRSPDGKGAIYRTQGSIWSATARFVREQGGSRVFVFGPAEPLAGPLTGLPATLVTPRRPILPQEAWTGGNLLFVGMPALTPAAREALKSAMKGAGGRPKVSFLLTTAEVEDLSKADRRLLRGIVSGRWCA